MPDEAIENILAFWKNNSRKERVAGIVGLDSYKSGEIIGNPFPDQLNQVTMENLYNKYKIKGDKKIVFRTEIVKKYNRYPIFKDERFVPLGTLYLLIDKDYELLCLNKVLCIVEYLEDGSSRNIIKQYYRHPKGFRYARIVHMKYSNFFKVRFKNAIHYVSHSLQLNDVKMFSKTPKKILTLFAFPFGILLAVYVWYINKYK